MKTLAMQALELTGVPLIDFLTKNGKRLLGYDRYKSLHYQDKNSYDVIEMNDGSYLYVMNISHIKYGGKYKLALADEYGEIKGDIIYGEYKK